MNFFFFFLISLLRLFFLEQVGRTNISVSVKGIFNIVAWRLLTALSSGAGTLTGKTSSGINEKVRNLHKIQTPDES